MWSRCRCVATTVFTRSSAIPFGAHAEEHDLGRTEDRLRIGARLAAPTAIDEHDVPIIAYDDGDGVAHPSLEAGAEEARGIDDRSGDAEVPARQEK
jgi:hypothetical protein